MIISNNCFDTIPNYYNDLDYDNCNYDVIGGYFRIQPDPQYEQVTNVKQFYFSGIETLMVVSPYLLYFTSCLDLIPL